MLSKSLVAAVDIPAGTPITRDMVTSKSPGLGLSAQLVRNLVGRSLPRDVRRDEMFLPADAEDQAVVQRSAREVDVGGAMGHRRPLHGPRQARGALRARSACTSSSST